MTIAIRTGRRARRARGARCGLGAGPRTTSVGSRTSCVGRSRRRARRGRRAGPGAAQPAHAASSGAGAAAAAQRGSATRQRDARDRCACPRPGGLSIVSVPSSADDAVGEPAQAAAGADVRAAGAVVGDDDLERVAVGARCSPTRVPLRTYLATFVRPSETTK